MTTDNIFIWENIVRPVMDKFNNYRNWRDQINLLQKLYFSKLDEDDVTELIRLIKQEDYRALLSLHKKKQNDEIILAERVRKIKTEEKENAEALELKKKIVRRKQRKTAKRPSQE